jgi:hypothetical protein
MRHRYLSQTRMLGLAELPQQAPSSPIFRITLYWNQAPFQDHLVLDNSGASSANPTW